MVIRKSFTIIELLVAITITTLMVNLLSTIYLRVNEMVIIQTGAVSTFNDGNANIGFLESELQNMTVDNGYWPIVSDDIAIGSASDRYPGIIYYKKSPMLSGTELGKISTGQSRGYREAALVLGPPEDGFSDEEPFLNLYSFENDNWDAAINNYENSFFDSFNSFSANINDSHKKLVAERVVFMQFEFEHMDNDGTIITSSTLDENESDSIRALTLRLSIAPLLPIELMPTTLDATQMTQAALEALNLTTQFNRSLGFQFQTSGYFANTNTGEVYLYQRPGNTSGTLGNATTLSITRVPIHNSRPAAYDGNSTSPLYTGFSFNRRIQLR